MAAKTTFFVFKARNADGQLEIRVGINSEQSVALVDLTKGLNYLGGQRLRVYQASDDAVWLSHVKGGMFSADPGTYSEGFGKGMQVLRSLCVRINNPNNPEKAEIIPIPSLGFCHVEKERETGIFQLFDYEGLVGINLNQWAEEMGTGVQTIPLPNNSGLGVNASISDGVLSLWSGVGVIILPSRRRNVSTCFCPTLDIDTSKGFMKAQTLPLEQCRELRRIPLLVLGDSLFFS